MVSTMTVDGAVVAVVVDAVVDAVERNQMPAQRQ